MGYSILFVGIVLVSCCTAYWYITKDYILLDTVYELERENRKPRTDFGISVKEAPLISLIVNPDVYDGETVSVSGFFSLGQELSHLFYTSEQQALLQIDNSLHIDLPDGWAEKLMPYNGRFCSIVGRFKKQPEGVFFHSRGGDIVDVEIISVSRRTP